MRARLATIDEADGLGAWQAAIGPRWLAAVEAGVAPAATALAPDLPLARLAVALALEPAEMQLVEWLVAAECEERLAERLPAGIPAPLARRLLPGLSVEAFAVAGTLRNYEVVRLGEGPRALAALRIGEGALDHLLGGDALDPLLAPCVGPIEIVEPALVGAAEALAAGLAERGPGGLSPALTLDWSEAEAASAVKALGFAPYRLLLSALPQDAGERLRWRTLWARDAALLEGVLIIPITSEIHHLAELIDGLLGHVLLLGDPPSGLSRPVRAIAKPRASGEAERWHRAFGPLVSARLAPALQGAARRFGLDAAQLGRIARETRAAIAAEPDDRLAGRMLWQAAARAVPPRPVTGAARREPRATWNDIVLPAPVAATLCRVEIHVRHAEQVIEGWGFGRRMGGRGLGVAALFAGPSGTGKTLAAEVLADALGLPMLVADLAQLSSKYIGETAKNVAALFAEAERTGAVMVWNEGDAVFGARGSVSSATDRHVNAEVGDLLQRIEAFTGFTIVTTNLKGAIDPAFLRRFRFIVDFPLPSETERRAIWARAFPAAMPCVLDDSALDSLARVPLSGGAIGSAALTAAFFAAENGRPVDLAMVGKALAAELAKTGQPMPQLMPAR